MPDLEMTKLCAEAIGFKFDCPLKEPYETISILDEVGRLYEYNPLHNDAQAMELVKRFRIVCRPCGDRLGDPFWDVAFSSTGASHENLNRAIVECVAKMQSAKGK